MVFDNHNDPHALRLAQLLQSFDCVQHVDEPTHRDGHTLDLVITRRDTTEHNVRVGDWLSDRALISVELDIRKPRQEHVETTSRRWSNLSLSAFEADLVSSRLCNDIQSLDGTSADVLAELYDAEMLSLLDKQRPVVKVRRKLSKLTPWLD